MVVSQSRFTEWVAWRVAPPFRFLATYASLEGAPSSSGGGALMSLVSGDQATAHQRTGAPASLTGSPRSSQVSDGMLGSVSGNSTAVAHLNRQGEHQVGIVVSAHEADSMVVPRSQGRSVGHSLLGQVEWISNAVMTRWDSRGCFCCDHAGSDPQDIGQVQREVALVTLIAPFWPSWSWFLSF